MEPKGTLQHLKPPFTFLSHINPVHAPYPTSQISTLILPSHLGLGLPSGLFPSHFPTKTLHEPLLSPICATYPAHLILLDLITPEIFGTHHTALHYVVFSTSIISSLIGPNILRSTLFSNTLSLCSSLTAKA